MARPDAEPGRIVAVFSLLSGVLSVLFLILTLVSPPGPHLSNYAGNIAFYEAYLVLILFWAVVSVPFVGGLRKMLGPRNSTLALSAALLSTGGILLLAFAVDMYVGTLVSILTAGNPPSLAETDYQVAIWRNLSFILTDPALMAWGLGQFLFGWLAWKSKTLPKWVAGIGMIGGVEGLLTEAVYQTPVLAVVQLASFGIWGIVVGITLLQPRRRP